MRSGATLNGVTVKAYAGTTGILLAIDVPPNKSHGLLGFALEREVAGNKKWLRSMLHFPGLAHVAGELSPTNVAPIQKFRWSDYGVLPNGRYRYTVHPVYGNPTAPSVQPGPTVGVRTHGAAGVEHFALFNRAAAASQAFSREFPEVEAELDEARREQREPNIPPKALDWLSRGVLDQITSFIAQALDHTWALDIAIYEYELGAIVDAVNAAASRGVNLRVIYHSKTGDPQTSENEEHLAALDPNLKHARKTSKIFHHKFIILSRMGSAARQPKAVLCGSTNFTHNGVYRQANVVHVLRDPTVAETYLSLFDVIFGGASVNRTRAYVDENNSISANNPTFAGFSPRSDRKDLVAFVRAINGAKRDVLFCTAFDLDDGVEDALLGGEHDRILRYGLQNSRSRITGLHRDRTARFSATAMLSSGLEGFLKESTKGQRGNILIHTKLIVVDFTSDSPIVVSGSHNFSAAASQGNDENFLIMSANRDIADCYGIELMRLYDHYRFRWFQREGFGPPELTPDDSWTSRYFRAGSLTQRDRLAFAGTG